jgi:hypothetical protein
MRRPPSILCHKSFFCHSAFVDSFLNSQLRSELRLPALGVNRQNLIEHAPPTFQTSRGHYYLAYLLPHLRTFVRPQNIRIDDR